MRRWVRSWWVTLRHGSVLTRSGRELRVRAHDPLSEYVEVTAPNSRGLDALVAYEDARLAKSEAFWAVRSPKSVLCHLGLHRWGIASWPSGERWCLRCGQRWSTS